MRKRAAAGAMAAIAVSAQSSFPDCVERGFVYRHAGAHGIFLDLSTYGSTGCWDGNCRQTDKFNSQDFGVCARACQQTQECTHWSFGAPAGSTTCFLRKSDGGLEAESSFFSGTKACAPPELSDASVAWKTASLPALRACDAGRSDDCPDLRRALRTWQFAIGALRRATAGLVDGKTQSLVEQIAADTDAFSEQFSEENFPVVAHNNRVLFSALEGWLQEQSPELPAVALPAPLRGELCGMTSCFD
eukprot:s1180_g2.t1